MSEDARVEPPPADEAGDDTIDRAWMVEARRRCEAVLSGKARTLSNGEVVARIEKVLARVRERNVAAGPISDAWIAELERRTAEYEAGRVELIDNDDVFEWVRARLREGTLKSDETTG